MNKIYFLLSLLSTSLLIAQEDISWNENYDIQLADFKSPKTNIGSKLTSSLFLPSAIQFNLAMNSVQFALTKNFNDKVTVRFQPEAAVLIAPDSIAARNLVNFANYQFDLSELYARKLRKELYLNKKIYTTITYIQAPFDANQKEFTARFSEASARTNMGQDIEKLEVLHQEVLKELNELAAYCQFCKLNNKKKST